MARIIQFRNARGDVVDLESIPATELKNALGRVIERAVQGGAVAITRHDRPRVVLVSYEDFQALAQAREPSLGALSDQFDRMLEAMQAPAAKKGADAAFGADGAQLGRAAVKAVRPPKALAARSAKKRKAHKAG